MTGMHNHLPMNTTMKSKVLSATCLAFIILSLYSTCYLLFFRTTGIDVTNDIDITYHGENGTATVLVQNKNINYNQRIREFMDTVTYKVTPNKKLSNGDVITIEASYDKALASRYHINPDHLKKDIIVSELPIRYVSAEVIPQTLLDTIDQQSQTYMDKNLSTILSDDFTSFYVTSKPKLEHYQRVYRLFLNANNDTLKDKLLDVYAITAEGEVNTSSEKEELETRQITIYYTITYNEINTSEQIVHENIYGEKMITNTKQDLSKTKSFISYMTQKYGSNYKLELIEEIH